MEYSKLNTGSDTNLTFINNSALGDAGGAAYLYSSTLSVESNVNVACINNSAQGGGGGAIYLYHSSTMNIGSGTNVMFIYNTALEQ